AQVEVRRASPRRPGGAAARGAQGFPYKRQVGTLVVDLGLIAAAYYAAYLLRFENAFAAHPEGFMATVVPLRAARPAALAALGAYHGLWRYASLADMVRLVRGITAGTAVGIVYLAFATRLEGLSRAVFVLDWLLLVLMIGASRASFRLL